MVGTPTPSYVSGNLTETRTGIHKAGWSKPHVEGSSQGTLYSMNVARGSGGIFSPSEYSRGERTPGDRRYPVSVVGDDTWGGDGEAGGKSEVGEDTPRRTVKESFDGFASRIDKQFEVRWVG